MTDLFWLKSSAMFEYVVRGGYMWVQFKLRRRVRWEVVPRVYLSSHPWEISTLETDFCHFKDHNRSTASHTTTTDAKENRTSDTISEISDQYHTASLSTSASNSYFTASNMSAEDLVGSVHRTEDVYTYQYDILDIIGRGKFGVVYKATRLSSPELVAVKCVNMGKSQIRELNELRILMSLQDCPNIVHMIDHFQLESKRYIVMELASGCLADIQVRHFDAEFIMNLFLDIQNAVGVMHERLIAHGDLKPGNVLIIKGRAVLADFGLSRCVRGANGQEIFVRGRVGSFAYMAPEVVANTGSRLYSALKADVWSVGCIIHFLLTGKKLFPGRDVKGMIAAHNKIRVNPKEFVLNNAMLASLFQSMRYALTFKPKHRPPVHMLLSPCFLLDTCSKEER